MPPEQDGNVIRRNAGTPAPGFSKALLEDFGVRGEIIHVRQPVVTLYEFEPAPGVKSSRVIGLADDIASTMSCLRAVVPGHNVIGIRTAERQPLKPSTCAK